MTPPRLIAVTNAEVVGDAATLARAHALCNGCKPGTVLIQLRDRGLPASRLASLGAGLSSCCRDAGQGFAVNDRLDLALLLGADAVHLGERSVTVADARRLLPDAVVYAAAHDRARVLSSTAHAVVLAPVIAARKGAPALGLEAFAEISAELRARPGAPLLYALGGVTAAHAAACLSAGAVGVAAQGAIWDDHAWQGLCSALEIAQ